MESKRHLIGLNSKNLSIEFEMELLNFNNFVKWWAVWYEEYLPFFGPKMGEACLTGVRPSFDLPLKTTTVSENILDNDGKIKKISKAWGPEHDAIRLQLSEDNIVQKNKWIENECKAWVAVIRSISKEVMDKIRAVQSEEFKEAVMNVDVVALMRIVRSVCLKVLKSNANMHHDEFTKLYFDSNKMSVKSWIAKVREKLATCEMAKERKFTEHELIYALREQVKNEWENELVYVPLRDLRSMHSGDPKLALWNDLLGCMIVFSDNTLQYRNRQMNSGNKRYGKNKRGRSTPDSTESHKVTRMRMSFHSGSEATD